jgi:hypothetical protein
MLGQEIEQTYKYIAHTRPINLTLGFSSADPPTAFDPSAKAKKSLLSSTHASRPT